MVTRTSQGMTYQTKADDPDGPSIHGQIWKDSVKLQNILERTATSSEEFWEYKFNTAESTFSGWFPTNASARRVAIAFPEVLSVVNPNNRIIYTKV